MSLYKRLLSPKVLETLEAMHADLGAAMTGTTPDDDLDTLAGLLVAGRAKNILQFGTFNGASAIIFADLAAQNGGGRVVTVDTAPQYNAMCRKYAERAEVAIETIDGSSLDPVLLKELDKQTWDAIYLDTTHQYFATRDEILGIEKLCDEHTLFLFHDASTFAADTLDMQKQGGVKRAILEFTVMRPRWQWFIFERPAFGQYGIGVMQKRVR